MVTKVYSNTFSGVGKVHDGTLAAAVRGFAQKIAKDEAASITDLTDSSTGTGGAGTIAAIALPAPYTTAGTDLFPKAGGETALGTVVNALAVLLHRANAVAGAVGLGASYFTDSTDGTVATPGTVAAVTKLTTAVTGASGNGMSATGGLAVLRDVRNSIAQAALAVNELAYATGVALLVDNSGGDAGGKITTFDEIDTDTGAATADGLALSGIADTAGEAFLSACANAVATIADKLDEMTATGSATPTVVAAK